MRALTGVLVMVACGHGSTDALVADADPEFIAPELDSAAHHSEEMMAVASIPAPLTMPSDLAGLPLDRLGSDQEPAQTSKSNAGSLLTVTPDSPPKDVSIPSGAGWLDAVDVRAVDGETLRDLTRGGCEREHDRLPALVVNTDSGSFDISCLLDLDTPELSDCPCVTARVQTLGTCVAVGEAG
ncbi:MAG: hypothetical protein ACI9MC_003259, partial [Kiritimatiellia bacterium]